MPYPKATVRKLLLTKHLLQPQEHSDQQFKTLVKIKSLQAHQETEISATIIIQLTHALTTSRK
jgi:hypothetical protein